MNKNEVAELFTAMHPDFFERESIRCVAEDMIFEEMVLSLEEFDAHCYEKPLGENITFGYYSGEFAELLKAVEKVEWYWTEIFSEEQRVYCGYVDGKLASFCIVEDMGVHSVGGRKIKVGGPGCVGTVPEYRHSGIGLTMVKNVTQILKAEGYDYSYIHYTAVAPWYEKLGYKTILKWCSRGIIPD